VIVIMGLGFVTVRQQLLLYFRDAEVKVLTKILEAQPGDEVVAAASNVGRLLDEGRGEERSFPAALQHRDRRFVTVHEGMLQLAVDVTESGSIRRVQIGKVEY
jgi:hypothetical protein